MGKLPSEGHINLINVTPFLDQPSSSMCTHIYKTGLLFKPRIVGRISQPSWRVLISLNQVDSQKERV